MKNLDFLNIFRLKRWWAVLKRIRFRWILSNDEIISYRFKGQ